MKVYETKIKDLLIIEPKIFGDSRGWFYESYSYEKFKSLGIDTVFVQDNRSFSSEKGTLRGLHCQTEPKSQTKLFCCTRGAVLDVAVDIRKSSDTYMQWFSIELNSLNKTMLYVPKGFLHGFMTLTDNVEVLYKVDEIYSPENDRSIRYDDPEIGINWGKNTPILSAKDMSAPILSRSDVSFE